MLLWIGLSAAAALLLGTLGTRISEARESARVSPPGRFVIVDGRRVHVVQRGTGGPSVVIESGGATSSVMWWPFLQRLAQTTTVLAYDRAGLGWSAPAPLPRSIEDRAEELALVLEASALPPPYVLVGLSYGGPIIRHFAARHPESVAGLVFVDVAHEAVFHRPGAKQYLRRSALMLRVVRFVASVGVLRLFRLRGIPTAPTALPFSPAETTLLEHRFPPAHSFAAGADEFRSMLSIEDSMSGVDGSGSHGDKPVAVITHGQPFPGPFAVLEEGHLDGQRALTELSSNGSLTVARESSHAVPLQEPELVISAIERVVQDVRRSASS